MRKEDTRVQYTKARFSDALLTLIEQQPIRSVSVRALCDEAGLNRGTFYLHYNEPIDVLREMEWALFDRAVISLDSYGSDSRRDRMLRQLQALRQEQRLCTAVISRNGDPHFLHEIGDKVFAALRNKLSSEDPSRSEPEMHARFSFMFAGCTGLISSWLEGNGLSDEETANMLSQLCDGVMQ